MSQGKTDIGKAGTENCSLGRVNIIIRAMGSYSRDLSGEDMM